MYGLGFVQNGIPRRTAQATACYLLILHGVFKCMIAKVFLLRRIAKMAGYDSFQARFESANTVCM
jgi:hypothetical protein